MSSVEYLRAFVKGRLTAAAEEIFVAFKNIVVKYEEEIDRQRYLLDVVRIPKIKLHRIELPQQHVCKEREVLPDQQLRDCSLDRNKEVVFDHQPCKEERSCSMDQEDPEPPQMKEEQEELCISQEEEQLVVKHETDNLMLTPTHEENDQSGDQTLYLNPDETISAAQRESVDNMMDIFSVEVEPNNNKKLLSLSSDVAETNTGGKPYVCSVCGKAVRQNSYLRVHMRIHTGEKPYVCEVCGKGFKSGVELKRHTRIHTGEKPYLCKTCGKCFQSRGYLIVHTRIHTDERPYVCKVCGKSFRDSTVLKVHMRIHTGEKPYVCKTCGKDFRQSYSFVVHMRTHKGEELYVCKVCEKAFESSQELLNHWRIHEREKPHAELTIQTNENPYS